MDVTCRNFRTSEFANLVEMARYRASHHPDRKAFVFLRNGEVEQSVLTFGELDRRARSLAVRLHERFEPGERIVLMHSQGHEFVVAFFACIYAGLVAVPVTPPSCSTGVSRLARIADDAGAAGVCLGREGFDGAALTQSGAHRRLECVVTSEDAGEREAEWIAPNIDPGNLALLQYTPGASRGVMASHANLLHNQSLIQHAFGHSPGTIGVSWLPLHHDMGLIGHVLQPVYVGCTSVLLSSAAFLAKPVRWLEAISRYRATTSGGPNFAYDIALRRVRAGQLIDLDLSRWSVAYNGSEPVHAETLAGFANKFAVCGFRPEAFVACYGLADATLLVSSSLRGRLPEVQMLDLDKLRRNRVHEATAATRSVRAVVSCGPVIDQDLLIVEPGGCTRCLPGEVGEIWLRGPSVAKGYWNQPQTTQAAFGARLAGGEGPFLRTGDLGFLLDGELYVTGKLSDLIEIGGRKHHPHDIEKTVRESHPLLDTGASVAVCLKGQRGQRRRLIIMQEVARDQLVRLPRDEILSSARGAVLKANGLKLEDIMFLAQGSLPRTASGLIRREACPSVCVDASRPGRTVYR
ncbi:MAG TPA: fatty acyl-AMP ligase [Burkholderiaceae bacterium]|nr:fatty acyl-AMP ligase [Burkholderiaceae bacterium]